MFWPTLRVGGGWEPWSEMARFQRDMNRLLNGYCQTAAGFPRLNVWANDEKAVVQAECPGVDPAALKLTVSGDVLTLEGERANGSPADDKAEAHRQERGTGAFARSVRLPFEIEEGKVGATHRNGVVTITLPRREATKPRAIAVTAE